MSCCLNMYTVLTSLFVVATVFDPVAGAGTQIHKQLLMMNK